MNVWSIFGSIGLDTRDVERGLKQSETAAKKTAGVLERDVGRGLDVVADRLGKISKSFTQLGQELSLKVTAPLLAFGVTALRVAGDFEQSMNRVAAVSGATGAELEMLTMKARELGATTQFSASQAADAMGFMAMAGMNVNEIMSSMESTLRLAAAAQLDMGTAADVVTNILAGYNMTVEELDHAVDVLTKTFTSANVDLSMLAESMKYVGPVAVAAGVQFEETAAAVGLLGNAGIQGSMAGTALRQAILNMLNPTAGAAEAMERLSLTVTDANGRMLPFADIIDQLGDKYDDTASLAEIFGARNVGAISALASQGGDALRALTAELEASGGTAERVAEAQMAGLNGSLRELRSAFEELQIAIANSGLLQWVENAARGFAGFLRELSAVNPEILRVGTIAAGFAALAGPLLLGIGQLTRAAQLAVLGFQALRTAMLFFTGPVGIAAVVATAIGVTLLNAFARADGVIKEAGERSVKTAESFRDAAKASDTFTDALDRDGLRSAVAGVAEELDVRGRGALEAFAREAFDTVEDVDALRDALAQEAARQSLLSATREAAAGLRGDARNALIEFADEVIATAATTEEAAGRIKTALLEAVNAGAIARLQARREGYMSQIDNLTDQLHGIEGDLARYTAEYLEIKAMYDAAVAGGTASRTLEFRVESALRAVTETQDLVGARGVDALGISRLLGMVQELDAEIAQLQGRTADPIEVVVQTRVEAPASSGSVGDGTVAGALKGVEEQAEEFVLDWYVHRIAVTTAALRAAEDAGSNSDPEAIAKIAEAREAAAQAIADWHAARLHAVTATLRQAEDTASITDPEAVAKLKTAREAAEQAISDWHAHRLHLVTAPLRLAEDAASVTDPAAVLAIQLAREDAEQAIADWYARRVVLTTETLRADEDAASLVDLDAVAKIEAAKLEADRAVADWQAQRIALTTASLRADEDAASLVDPAAVAAIAKAKVDAEQAIADWFAMRLHVTTRSLRMDEDAAGAGGGHAATLAARAASAQARLDAEAQRLAGSQRGLRADEDAGLQPRAAIVADRAADALARLTERSQAVVNAIDAFGTAILGRVPILGEAFGALNLSVDEASGKIKVAFDPMQMLADILGRLLGASESLTEWISHVMEALQPLAEMLGDAVVRALAPFVDALILLLSATMPIVEVLIQLLGAGLRPMIWVIENLLVPAFKFVADAIVTIYNALLGWLFGRISTDSRSNAGATGGAAMGNTSLGPLTFQQMAPGGRRGGADGANDTIEVGNSDTYLAWERGGSPVWKGSHLPTNTITGVQARISLLRSALNLADTQEWRNAILAEITRYEGMLRGMQATTPTTPAPGGSSFTSPTFSTPSFPGGSTPGAPDVTWGDGDLNPSTPLFGTAGAAVQMAVATPIVEASVNMLEASRVMQSVFGGMLPTSTQSPDAGLSAMPPFTAALERLTPVLERLLAEGVSISASVAGGGTVTRPSWFPRYV